MITQQDDPSTYDPSEVKSFDLPGLIIPQRQIANNYCKMYVSACSIEYAIFGRSHPAYCWGASSYLIL